MELTGTFISGLAKEITIYFVFQYTLAGYTGENKITGIHFDVMKIQLQEAYKYAQVSAPRISSCFLWPRIIYQSLDRRKDLSFSFPRGNHQFLH